EGAASMRAHRVGVWGCGQCSFCITFHQLSPPHHRPSPRHPHSPLSLCNHGDFRAAAKCKFLYDAHITLIGARGVTPVVCQFSSELWLNQDLITGYMSPAPHLSDKHRF